MKFPFTLSSLQPSILQMAFIKPAALFILLLFSCNTNRNASLSDLGSLYDGRFTIENRIRTNLSNGKEDYIRLISSKNSLVAEGWLLPEAMANNCSILFFRNNYLLFKDKDFLEVEIQIKDADPLVFKYTPGELQESVKTYDSIERVIKDLVENTLANNKNKVKNVGYTASNQEENFDSFFEAFSNAIPHNYKNTRLISYSVNSGGLMTEYLVDGVLRTQDNVQKMINIRLVRTENEIKIKEVKF